MGKFHLLYTVNVNVDLAQKVKVVCLNFNVRSFIICHCFVTGDIGRPLVIQPNMAPDTGGLGVSLMLFSVSSHVNLVTDFLTLIDIKKIGISNLQKLDSPINDHPSLFYIQFRNILI